jgi:uncharacterized alkaline shock family protein YloU
MHSGLQQIDAKEVELPDTLFIWDIETKVFQSIVLQCLAKIEGVALLEGNFIDNLLGRESSERIKGIYVDQDEKHRSIKIKIEINIAYGILIPKKAEEVQMKIAEEVSQLTGLHVGSVHVIFKNLIPLKHEKEGVEEQVFSGAGH